ncbi:MAG: hypothetical protein ACFFG0_09520 [Candidatus Thorarchaeota archaeon]
MTNNKKNIKRANIKPSFNTKDLKTYLDREEEKEDDKIYYKNKAMFTYSKK